MKARAGQRLPHSPARARVWRAGWVSPIAHLSLVACLGALAGSVGAQSPTSGAVPTPGVAGRAAGAQGLVAPAESELGLLQFVRQIRAVNKTIRSKQNERDITQTGIDRAQSMFQPQATASAMNGRQRLKNTPEEDVVRQGLGLYDRIGQDYSVGVSQLLASGAKVEGKATLSRFLTNITRNIRQTDDNDYKAFYGLTVTQPLARDAGVEVTLARLRMAELDTLAAEHASGDTEASTVAEAMFAYWDLLFAQERLGSALEKVRMGERLLQESRALNRQGRLPLSEVWEVENNLGRYQSGVSEAQQGVQERANKVRTLLMETVNETPAPLKAIDRLPEVAARLVSAEQALRQALERRDDYRMRKAMLEREGVQLAYAQNQGLPRIDLVASYGLNGLEMSGARAFSYGRMNDYPTWSLGLQFTMPLGENLQARADLQAARLRKEDALLQLKALEVAITNDIDTGIGMMTSAFERWTLLRQVAEREQRQLELERVRLTAGRSDMREILLREERAINARLAVVEQQLAWGKADVLIDAAQGSLLERFK